MKKISIIVPMFNEEEVAQECYKKLKEVVYSISGYDYEFIFVNDGSRDKTLDILKVLAVNDRKVKVVSFSRNFGHQNAVCAGLKEVKNHKNEFLKFIKPYLKSKNEFEVRFAVIILLDYYIDEEHIDFILETLNKIKRKEYYIQMAIAWCYSICFVKFYDKTLKFFKENDIDKFVRNKSIQKAKESFRITKEQKEELNKLKV